MQGTPGTPPPFHTRGRSRTRPSRRRATRPATPDLALLRGRLSRSSVAIAALIAVLSIGSAALARSRAGDPPALPASAPPDAVAVAVTRIIDGDTLEVRSAATTLRVRLYGVDAPERGEACAIAASERLAGLAGDRVLLVPDARSVDGFGRELRYVFTVDGRSIDEALVREGLALAWREDGSRRAALVAAEEAARASRSGCLWSSR